MKPLSAFKFSATAMGFAALFTPVSAAMAGGVPAGTSIDSNAVAQFSAGSAPEEITSNTVSVVVNEVLDVAIAAQNGGVVESAGTAILTLAVTNTGNGPEAFTLTANPNVAGNDFDAEIDTLAVDSNDNGIYDAGIDTEVTNGGTSAVVEADGSLTVFVIATIPGSAGDGETSQIELRAEAATGAGAAGTVPVDDLIVTDAIPTGTTCVAGSIALDAASQTDAADADAVQDSATAISLDFGTVAAGTSHLISLHTTIN